MKRTHIGKHRLEALRDHYRRYLFKEYLPFWQRHGIDHDLGGFMCAIDHDGSLKHQTESGPDRVGKRF